MTALFSTTMKRASGLGRSVPAERFSPAEEVRSKGISTSASVGAFGPMARTRPSSAPMKRSPSETAGDDMTYSPTL
jgi:hypothetical protein